MYNFVKEEALPSSSKDSPYYSNLPSPGSKPIDSLIFYFKCWKKFIKSLIYYLKEVALVKEFTSKINLQLINSVLFPGAMNLPLKYMTEVSSSISTPPKEVKKTLSGNSLVSMGQGNHSSSDLSVNQSRPHLFKTKSNQSFLKPKSHLQLTHSPTWSSGTSPQKDGGAITPVPTNSSTTSGNGHHKNLSLGSLTSFTGERKDKQQHNGNGSSGNPSGHSHASDEAQQPRGKLYDNDIQVPKNFFNPETSLFPNLPNLLVDDHYHAYQGELKTFKDINSKLVGRLESLLKNLTIKIKEIKSSLRNDSFANQNLVKEISDTGRILNNYMTSVERYSRADKPVLKRIVTEDGNDDEEEMGVLDDPFLLKLKVDYQLKTQLVQENYGFAAYLNLQNIARDLSNYVLKDLKIITNKFGKLIDQESCYNDQSVSALYNQLVKVTSATKPEDEWNYFIAHNSNFINTQPNIPGATNPYKHARSFNSLVIPYSNSVHNKCIRNGMIYKKLKILKNYNAFYYILTCNYLHEYKVPDSCSGDGSKKDGKSEKKKHEARNKIGGIIGPFDVPEKSYNLNDYCLKIKNDDKFILQLISNKSKKFIFKCSSEQEFNNWWTDLLEVLKFGPRHLERFEFVESKILKVKQSKTSPKGGARSGTSSGVGSVNVSPVVTPPAKMTLNLGGLNNNTALNAMYTPCIVTPQPLDAHGRKVEEKNPFESTFFEDGSHNATVPTTPDGVASLNNSQKSHYSPANSPLQSPTISTSYILGGVVSSPNGSSGSSSGAAGVPVAENQASEVIVAHENYLQIQKQYLRQQQDLLNEKIKANEEQQQHIPNLHRASSSSSLNSIMPPQSNINTLLNNFQLPKPDRNELAPTDSASSIPTVFVSSDH